MSESIRVLHVEDDPDFAALTADYLERTNGDVRVTTEADVDAALEGFRAAAIDCVVSDYDLADADGITFLERVREIDERIPFILFTGKGSEEVASDALAAGATDYLQKERGTDQFAVLANRIENAVERHRAIAELERQNDLHRSAEEIADLCAWEHDVETGESWLSDGAYRVLGLPESYEPTREAARTHFHPEDRDRVTAAVDRALEDGQSYDIEARYVGGTGDTQWVRLKGDPTMVDGEVVGVRATIQDVTERKEREQELGRYETIVEAAGDPVYTLDDEGRFTFVNDSLEEFTGYEEDDLLGEHVSMMMDEADLERGTATVQSLVVLDERRRGTFEMEAITADGDRIPCEVHIALLPTEDEFRGTVGVVRSAIERKRRERELRRFEAIMEAVPVGVFLLDEKGGLIEANERAATMAGLTREEWLGESFLELVDRGIVHESAVEQYLERVRDLLSDETDTDVATIETELHPPDAEEPRIVEAHFTLLPYDSEFEGTVGVYRDVTRQRTRERAVERKNRRLEEFAHIVSHDLRNPLNVAKSRLELARDEHDSEHLDSMDDALWRMEAILEDTLTLARQDADVEDPRDVDLADLARRAWPGDGSDAAELRVEGDVTVSGDPTRLELVLSNLLENAIQHAGAGVTVRVGPMTDGEFYVADDGPGIPPDDRERVFDPGYSTDPDGTGFGLAIVEHVVEAHGWEIDVTESETGGARFEIVDSGPL